MQFEIRKRPHYYLAPVFFILLSATLALVLAFFVVDFTRQTLLHDSVLIRLQEQGIGVWLMLTFSLLFILAMLALILYFLFFSVRYNLKKIKSQRYTGMRYLSAFIDVDKARTLISDSPFEEISSKNGDSLRLFQNRYLTLVQAKLRAPQLLLNDSIVELMLGHDEENDMRLFLYLVNGEKIAFPASLVSDIIETALTARRAWPTLFIISEDDPPEIKKRLQRSIASRAKRFHVFLGEHAPEEIYVLRESIRAELSYQIIDEAWINRCFEKL